MITGSWTGGIRLQSWEVVVKQEGAVVVGIHLLSIGSGGPGTQRVEGVMAGHCLQKLGLHLTLPGPLHAVS